VDGFNVCGLEPKDYFANDPHPNPAGYQKIASCVEKVMLELN
jgi:lysophospholipase L1-like esterase